MSPFNLLLDIAARSKRNASELPQQIEAVEYWRGVGFMLAGQRYVAQMSEAQEILQPPKVTKIPGVKSWVLGVANIRGRLVPIFDLAGFFDTSSGSDWRARRVLVVEHGEQLYGLLVDAVYGMNQFPVDELNTSGVVVAEKVQPFVQGAFLKDGAQWPLLSFDELVQSAEFMQIAV